MSSLQSRVLVAVIGVPVLVWVVLWAPPLVMLVALCLLAGIGGMELQRCVSGAPRSELVGMSAIFPVFMVAWYYERPEHVVVLVVVELVVFFGYAIVKGGEIKFNQIMAALFGGTFIGYSFAAFLRLEAAGIHRAYLLLPFILSFACDTFAYFAGRAFGRHKLAPKVSPKKTVEGSIGGILGNVVDLRFCNGSLARGRHWLWNDGGSGSDVQYRGPDRRSELLPYQTGIRHQGLRSFVFGARRRAGPV